MKKYSLALILPILFFAGHAFASGSFDKTSPQIVLHNPVFTCDTGNEFNIFRSDGSLVNGPFDCNSGINYNTITVAGTVNYVECNPIFTGACGQGNYHNSITVLGFVSDNPFTFISAPPPIIPKGIDIFGGTAPSVGAPVYGSDFVTGTASALQSTIGLNGLGLILAIVIGLILVWIFLSYVIDLTTEAQERARKK